MKTMKLMTLAAGLMLFQAVAHAEMISGTITSIDMSAQKISLQRADTDKRIVLHVKDASLLNDLQADTQVTVDADRKIFGGWEAKSIDTAGADVSAQTSANEASKSDTIANREAVNSASSANTSDAATPSASSAGAVNSSASDRSASASNVSPERDMPLNSGNTARTAAANPNADLEAGASADANANNAYDSDASGRANVSNNGTR